MSKSYHLDRGTAYRVIEALHTREGAVLGAGEDEYRRGSGFGLHARDGRATVTPDDADADAAFRAECERQGVDWRRDWT